MTLEEATQKKAELTKMVRYWQSVTVECYPGGAYYLRCVFTNDNSVWLYGGDGFDEVKIGPKKGDV